MAINDYHRLGFEPNENGNYSHVTADDIEAAFIKKQPTLKTIAAKEHLTKLQDKAKLDQAIQDDPYSVVTEPAEGIRLPIICVIVDIKRNLANPEAVTALIAKLNSETLRDSERDYVKSALLPVLPADAPVRAILTGYLAAIPAKPLPQYLQELMTPEKFEALSTDRQNLLKQNKGLVDLLRAKKFTLADVQKLSLEALSAFNLPHIANNQYIQFIKDLKQIRYVYSIPSHWKDDEVIFYYLDFQHICPTKHISDQSLSIMVSRARINSPDEILPVLKSFNHHFVETDGLCTFLLNATEKKFIDDAIKMALENCVKDLSQTNSTFSQSIDKDKVFDYFRAAFKVAFDEAKSNSISQADQVNFSTLFLDARYKFNPKTEKLIDILGNSHLCIKKVSISYLEMLFFIDDDAERLAFLFDRIKKIVSDIIEKYLSSAPQVSHSCSSALFSKISDGPGYIGRKRAENLSQAFESLKSTEEQLVSLRQIIFDDGLFASAWTNKSLNFLLAQNLILASGDSTYCKIENWEGYREPATIKKDNFLRDYATIENLIKKLLKPALQTRLQA